MVDDIIYLPWGISTAISVGIQVALRCALLVGPVEGVDNLYLVKIKPPQRHTVSSCQLNR